MASRYNLKWRCVAGPCRPPPTLTGCHAHNNWAPLFLLQASGVPAGEADAGFDFNPDAWARWMRSSAACASLRDM